MKISDVIQNFSFSAENVLKKYGKWFLKMCGNLASSRLLVMLAIACMGFQILI